jgi:hypothetical protein
MGLSVVDEAGLRVVEGVPDQRLMSRAEDAGLLVEACLSHEVRHALLYAGNLPDAFFDLSSGAAGVVLQKLRNYGVRLALVCPEGSARFSNRFREMVAEERTRRDFGIFATRESARQWLAR